MKKKSLFLMVAIIVLVVFSGKNATAENLAKEPLVLLMQSAGNVNYSTGGDLWKPVRRNKFLYDGWKVKTGKKGGGKLLDQQTNKVRILAPETEVLIKSSGVQLKKGSLSEPKSATSFAGFLSRKFAEIQKYASVQRRVNPENRVLLKTASKISLSSDYPELIWESVGPEYGYQLVVDNKSYEVRQSSETVIRYSLKDLAPGRYKYQVKVKYQGEVLFSPVKKSTIVWLDSEKNGELKKKMEELNMIDPGNGYLLGNLFDEYGVKVEAMNQYQGYLENYPEANTVRPYLIKVMHDLGLLTLQGKEVRKYHKEGGG